MSFILLVLYILINTLIFGLYYRKDYGIFQTPCLFSLVSLIFVVPQLFQIIEFVQDPDSYMTLSLLVMISCNIAIFYGFKLGNKYSIFNSANITFNRRRVIHVLIIFAVVGGVATFMNRGAYKGGFVSGTFVVINFFSSYLDYLLIIILTVLYRKGSIPKLFWAILALVFIIQVDKFLISARRGEAIQFVLTISFFYFYIHGQYKYQHLKWIIPLFFVLGLFFNSQIGQYRLNAYSGEMSVAENVEQLSFSFTKEITTLENLEVNNAILGINSCYNTGGYDYGTFNWNGIIKNFIPKSLGGAKFKESLMFDNENESMVEFLCKSGSTMTGYYDAFTSFGIFAWIKFLIIGLILGRLWKESNRSVNALVLYVALMSPSLHSITHSSNNFFSAIVFFVLFISPFLKYCSIKYNKL